MSTDRILRRLIIWDIKLQARENVYLFTLFTTWESVVSIERRLDR